MPRATSRRPKRIKLFWGLDQLEVDDPYWIEKIVQEMPKYRQHAEDLGPRLLEPYSRLNESIGASLGYAAPQTPPKQMGYQAPDQQGPVAAEALRVFLGLELPVALNFTDTWGRSKSRMSAVHTAFRPCFHYCLPDELDLCWMFNGYQLYSTHQIGTAHFRPRHTDSSGHIERRLLNGQWVRWGFDGGSIPPAGRRWSWNRRTFIFANSDIHRFDRGDLDLEPEFDDRDGENDAEDGIPQSQDAL